MHFCVRSAFLLERNFVFFFLWPAFKTLHMQVKDLQFDTEQKETKPEVSTLAIPLEIIISRSSSLVTGR